MAEKVCFDCGTVLIAEDDKTGHSGFNWYCPKCKQYIDDGSDITKENIYKWIKGGFNMYIKPHVDTSLKHQIAIEKIENLLTDFPDIIGMLKNFETMILGDVFGIKKKKDPYKVSVPKNFWESILENESILGENSVPKGETVSLEKPPMDAKRESGCSLQNSTPEESLKEKPAEPIYLNPQLQCDGECYSCVDNIPSHGSVPNQCGRQQKKEMMSKFHYISQPPYKYCKFCGRELILYKEQWICGHGCLKPAVKPDIKNLTNKESSKDIIIKTGNMITKSLDKIQEVINPPKIDKIKVQNALNKCFKHTLNYKGIIQIFPNATYNIDGKDVVKLYEELDIKNEKN